MLNSETPKNKRKKPIKNHLNIVKEGHGFPSNVAPRDKQFLIRRTGSQVETIYQPEVPSLEREIPSPQQTQRSEKKS